MDGAAPEQGRRRHEDAALDAGRRAGRSHGFALDPTLESKTQAGGPASVNGGGARAHDDGGARAHDGGLDDDDGDGDGDGSSSGGGGDGADATSGYYSQARLRADQHTTRIAADGPSGDDMLIGDAFMPPPGFAIHDGTNVAIPHERPSPPRRELDSDVLEMRKIATEALDDTIEILAFKTRNEENTANAEKSRQIFGMNWLMRNCEPQPDTAVPRNRIYARYVAVCASARVKPLNPASFGKQVRAVFPHIKTRRLGIRGKSKYHYCGIRILDEPCFAPQEPARYPHNEPSPPDRPSAPTPRPADMDWMSQVQSSKLCFDTKVPMSSHIVNCAFNLLPIDEYLPENTDPDTSNTLYSLYKSHCSSLIESIRYMRLKQFFSTIASFHGILTAPVQNLLTHEALAPWILRADYSMYKEMLILLSPLALQVVPQSILLALKSLETSLPAHIQNAHANNGRHLLDAKLAPATAFINLLARLLRVNDTAHAAAKFLSNPADRLLMHRDWIQFVNVPALVSKEVPCGQATAIEILEKGIPALLVNSGSDRTYRDGYPNDTAFLSLVSPTRATNQLNEHNHSSGMPPAGPNDDPSYQVGEQGHVPTAIEGAIDRWALWLSMLPYQFPNCPPRIFLWAMGGVGTSALREITVAGGEGFGAWWVVRCWIDEWMAWIAEKGGFLNATCPFDQNIDYRTGLQMLGGSKFV